MFEMLKLVGFFQYVAVILMLKSLNDKGYNPLAMSIPSLKDLTIMVNLAGPVLLTMLSKVISCTFSFKAASGPFDYLWKFLDYAEDFIMPWRPSFS